LHVLLQKLAIGLGIVASCAAVAYALLFCIGALGIAVAGLWDPASRTWPLLIGAPITLAVAMLLLRPQPAPNARRRRLGKMVRSWAPAAVLSAAVTSYWIISILAHRP
jgi:hypothetical protein